MLIRTEKRPSRKTKIGKQRYKTWYLIRCEWCGKEEWFISPKHQGKNKIRKYCSKKCAGFSRRIKGPGNCNICGTRLTEKNWPQSFEKCYKYVCNNCEVNRVREYEKKLILSVIQKYGGRCTCCGETRIWLLTMDHVNGGGKKDMRKRFNGHNKQFYKWLKDTPVSPEYRVFCWNCNSGKRNYHACPHDIEKFQKVIEQRQSKSYSKYRLKLKRQVIEIMGEKCEICGENNPFFLTIHHIHNDGAQERKYLADVTLYTMIRDGKADMSRYQLLCYNCNCSQRSIFKKDSNE